MSSLERRLHDERKARQIRLGMYQAMPFATRIVRPREPEILVFPVIPDDRCSAEFDAGEGISIDHIKRVVCKYFDLTASELISNARPGNLVYARQIMMYLARRYTRHSSTSIGRKLGGRDHTTVLHGIGRIGRDIRKDVGTAYDIAHIEALL